MHSINPAIQLPSSFCLSPFTFCLLTLQSQSPEKLSYQAVGRNDEGTVVGDAKATSNYTTYGVLYNWRASLLACPSGWHLPTDA